MAQEPDSRTTILSDISQAIGNTPMVRLNRVGKDLDCEIVVKCEFMNPGGSVKDRIGREMINEAAKAGRIKPGDTVIEPTSGNTGIGLSMVCAAKGYHAILTMPEKMSDEKIQTLKALGSTIYRTPTEAAWNAPDSHISEAERLRAKDPQSRVILDQYSNPANPGAHARTTAQEIIQQTGGNIDMLVIGAGTGGTISGIAKVIKQQIPSCKIVGVDPKGSILHDPENAVVQGYDVEGIGYDFVPKVLDLSLVDEWVVVDDKQSFLTARRLIEEEGLLCGGSSGTAMAAALQVARRLKKGQRCLVLLPDSIRNYMTKFLNDDWMIDRGYMTKAREGQVIVTRPGGLPQNMRPKPTGPSANALVGLAVGAVIGALIGASLCRSSK